MTSIDSTRPEHRCIRCGRSLRSAASIAAGYGAGCRAKIRKAAATADTSAWTRSQIEDAREVIEDGGVVPASRQGVFHVVSSDGTEVYITHPAGCNCAAGLRTRQLRPCYHRAAVVIVLATYETARPHPRPLALAA